MPTIGPVHPDAVTASLFSDVIDVARTESLLSYDKNRRWFASKTETVLVEHIVHGPQETLFPVLSRRGPGSISVHVYDHICRTEAYVPSASSAVPPSEERSHRRAAPRSPRLEPVG